MIFMPSPGEVFRYLNAENLENQKSLVSAFLLLQLFSEECWPISSAWLKMKGESLSKKGINKCNKI